jgi:hypothetical protein
MLNITQYAPRTPGLQRGYLESCGSHKIMEVSSLAFIITRPTVQAQPPVTKESVRRGKTGNLVKRSEP